MKKITLNRFSPLFLKNKSLKNRVIVPAMASETADASGFVTDETRSHYQRLTESRAGLIILEYSYVHLSGRSESRQLAIDADSKIDGLSSVARLIRDTGAIAGIQLTHSGGKTQRDFTDGEIQGVSSKPVPVKDQNMESPTPLSLDQILQWKSWFIRATDRAVKAGFELVELHAAHGYGLNQFLSPITNDREDEYGGNFENNTRLLIEIINEIKVLYPHLLLSVRIPGQDFLDGGFSHEDSLRLAQTLESLGVDVINVSSGIGGWRRPKDRRGQGYLVDEAGLIQPHVRTPVIGVGGIEQGDYIDKIILEGKVSLAAVGRAILKDPCSWGKLQLNN